MDLNIIGPYYPSCLNLYFMNYLLHNSPIGMELSAFYISNINSLIRIKHHISVVSTEIFLKIQR